MPGSTGTTPTPTPTPAPAPAPSVMEKRGCLEAAQSALIAATVTTMVVLLFVLGVKCCSPCCDKEDKEQDKIETVHDTIYVPVKPAPVKKKPAKPATVKKTPAKGVDVSVHLDNGSVNSGTIIVNNGGTVNTCCGENTATVVRDTIIVRDTVRVPAQTPVAEQPVQKYNGGSATVTYVVRMRGVHTR